MNTAARASQRLSSTSQKSPSRASRSVDPIHVTMPITLHQSTGETVVTDPGNRRYSVEAEQDLHNRIPKVGGGSGTSIKKEIYATMIS